MLAILRRSLNTWPARLLFMLLIVAFGLWGIADVVRNIGSSGAPVRVAGRSIQLPELEEAYRRNLAQTTRQMGNTDPSLDIRRGIAMQSIEQVVTQTALSAQAEDLGLAVPDDALRQAVFSMPAFLAKDGTFSRPAMDAVLRNNGLTEQHFLAIMHDDLMQRQMLGAVAAGATAPDVLVSTAYGFQHEKRVADAVDVPFAAAAAPPAPTEAQLNRWWANHPDHYSTPEYRKIKAIVLSPETVSKDIEVSDDDLKAAWDQHKGEFNTAEKRSVDVILTQDQAEAERLAQQWQAGADWAAMQAAAAKVGAAPVELSDATRSEFPAPELGDAVFATPEDTVPPPVHSALGWHVLKVTKIIPGAAQTFDAAKPALRQRVVAEKAADVIYDRANRIENLLSSGTNLDDLPGDLGVAAVTGTLDATGNTQAGQPAPLPGPEALKQALVAAAFQARQGDAPKLSQAPNAPDGAQSFYAVSVEGITPPAPRPFDQVAEQVRADWTADAVRHEQEEIAAKLLTAMKDGKSLSDAAGAVGLAARRLPAADRSGAEGVPQQLLGPLFSLKKPGEVTMIETPQGFVVATLAEIQDPDPKSDPAGWAEMKDALARTVAEDLQTVFATAVRDRDRPHVAQSAIDSLAGGAE